MHSEQVKQFVETNKFPIHEGNYQSRCVDGRGALGEDIEKLPAISKPGADIGDLMIIFGALNKLGVNLPPEEIMDVILNTYGGSKNIKFHTDSHAEDKQAGPGRGCGHINKATLEPEDYHLTAEQTEFIHQLLPNLLESGAKQAVLDGDHNEKAVLVINSEHYAVKPNDQETQAFIYQQTLHHQQLDELAAPLANKISAHTGTELLSGELREVIDQVFDTQLKATLKRIAEGLPIYQVEIDQPGDVKVLQLGV